MQSDPLGVFGGGLMGDFRPSNLLDFAMERARQPQPAQQPLQGASGLLASLFGAPDPRLSPEQNQRLQSLALIAAGSQLADDPGNFAGGVGRAIGAGQNMFEQAKQRVMNSSFDRKLQSVMQGEADPSPSHLQRLAVTALGLGRPDDAKVLMALAGGGENAPPPDVFVTADADGNPIRVAVDKQTGRELWRREVPMTGTERKQFQAQQANQLRDDFERSIGQDAQQVASAFGRVKAAPATPAGDVGMLFSIMKMFDPGSVVREGEFATAANTAGVPDRFRNFYNRLLSGERLTDKQRRDFAATAAALAQQARTQLQESIARYSAIAERQGADPRDVVYDPFDGLGIMPRPAAPAPSVGTEGWQIDPLLQGGS